MSDDTYVGLVGDIPGAPLPVRWTGQGFAEWRRSLTPAQEERLRSIVRFMGLKSERWFWASYLPEVKPGQPPKALE